MAASLGQCELGWWWPVAGVALAAVDRGDGVPAAGGL